jgi:type IV secretory pathway VirB10-like protein
MKRPLFLALALAFTALAFADQALAQQYKWLDKNGKTQYGDTPPPGVKATPLKMPSSGPAAAPAPASKDAKNEPKGPLTPAQQDAEFRNRQKDAEKAKEKEAKGAEETQVKRDNCSSAQEQLRVLESGQRVARTDAAGERYYIDDQQRNAGIANARKLVQQWCGG